MVAGQRRVLVDQTALSLAELLDGNAGAEAIITEKTVSPNREPVRYACTIIGIPQRTSEELATTGLPNAAPRVPDKGSIILVRTSDGVKAVPIENIQDVTFKTPHKSKVSHEEFRNLLTLKLDWGTRKPAPAAPVGLVYLQKGFRWIPGYRVTLDGNGTAAIKLQTTLLNELADIDDVTANLVIGVPSFAFRDTMDPIALQQSVAQLSQYFQPGDRMQMMSNAILTQSARIGGQSSAASGPEPPNLGPDVPESTKSEDLFVFTVRHVTMKKGERLVAGVAEYTIPYADVFTLDLPFAPPSEVQANLNTEQEAEMARLFSAPKVAHKVRFTNKGSYPLTTAPALVVRESRVLAQGLITYTAVNATSDLEITKAVDIQVAKTDAETARVPECGAVDGQRVRESRSGWNDQADQLSGQGGGHRSDQARARQRHRRRQRRRRRQGERARGRQFQVGRVAPVVALVQLAELVAALQRRGTHHVEGEDRTRAERRSRVHVALFLAVGPDFTFMT